MRVLSTCRNHPLPLLHTSRLCLLTGLHLIEDGFEVRLLAITTRDLRSYLSISVRTGRQQGAELLVLPCIAPACRSRPAFQLLPSAASGPQHRAEEGTGGSSPPARSVLAGRVPLWRCQISPAADAIAARLTDRRRGHCHRKVVWFGLRSSLARLATMGWPLHLAITQTTPETT